MARVEIIDQTLRDGQQSYWGMRMQAGQILPVAEAIDGAGYRVVDLTGSSIFEVMVRFREENPWKGLDAIRAALPNSTLRAGTRSNGVVGMNVTPDSIGSKADGAMVSELVIQVKAELERLREQVQNVE